jgi:hypothetical protein
MATPVMQGVAQQLILDRRVGSYVVPDGWCLWAAGNRKEDRASVFDMPAPLANRFIHLQVEVDNRSFRTFALQHNFHEQIIAFLGYRPELLHKLDPGRSAWPSPRTWEFASRLHHAGLDVAPAVGEGPAAEFSAFVALYRNLPDIEGILAGTQHPDFPNEPSTRYALVIGLVARAETADQIVNGLRYLTSKAPAEWIQLYAVDAIPLLRARGELTLLAGLLRADPDLAAFMREYRELIGLGAPSPGAPETLVDRKKR